MNLKFQKYLNKTLVRSLVIVLCFSLTLPHLGLNHLRASSVNSPEEAKALALAHERITEYNSLLDELSLKADNPSRAPFLLDRFRLLDQEVYKPYMDDVANLKSAIMKNEIVLHQIDEVGRAFSNIGLKFDSEEDKIFTAFNFVSTHLEGFSKGIDEKIAAYFEYHLIGDKKKLAGFKKKYKVDNAGNKVKKRNRAALGYKKLASGYSSFELSESTKNLINESGLKIEGSQLKINESVVTEYFDSIKENVLDFVDDNPSKPNYYKSNLTLVIRDLKGEEVTSQKQRTFLNPMEVKNGYQSELYGEEVKFSLFSKDGIELHRFHRPVQFAQVYGEFVLYQEKGSDKLLFIDMRYFKDNLGDTRLPVFEYPLNLTKETKSVEIKDGSLFINGDQKINRASLGFISRINEITFNIAVGMSDPESFSRSKNLIKELGHYFDKMMEEQGNKIKNKLQLSLHNTEKLQEFLGQQKRDVDLLAKSKGFDSIPDAPDGLDKEEAIIYKQLKSKGELNSVLLDSNRGVQNSRKFLTRLNLTISKMTMPRPTGVKVLTKNLYMLVGFAKSKEERMTAFDNIAELKIYKMMKYGAVASGAIYLGGQLPETYAFNLMDVLAIGKAGAQGTMSYLQNMEYGLAFPKLFASQAAIVFEGPLHVLDYFSGGNSGKFLMGITSVLAMPMMLFAVPHFIVNSLSAMKGMSGKWNGLRDQGFSKIETLKKSFIEHVAGNREMYTQALSEAEKGVSGGEIDLPEQELEELKEIIKDLKSKAPKEGKVAKMFAKVKSQLGKMTSIFKKSSDDVKEIKTLGSAFKDFMLSYPSLTNTFRFLGVAWNYFFLSRSFFFKPSTWAVPFIYPNYYSVSSDSVTILKDGTQRIAKRLQDDEKQKISHGVQHHASDFNGGRKTWAQIFKERTSNTSSELKALRQWEEAIIPVEQIAQQVALQKALGALAKNIKKSDTLKTFFESATPNLSQSPSTGIEDLASKAIHNLKGKDKAFFRAYFTRIFDETMVEYLKSEAINKQGEKVRSKIEAMNLKEIKAESISWLDDLEEHSEKLSTSSEVRTKLTAEISKVADKVEETKSIVEFADKASRELGFFFNRRKENFRHGMYKTMTPASLQVSRYLVSKRGLKNPKAVARAVREQVASLLINQPIGILAAIIMYAGVEGSVLQIFHPDEMFGPNSFFYLSRYLFLNGLVIGTVMGMAGDIWIKVQMDNRLASQGGFDTVPLKGDMKRGFWKYYFKNWKNPQNSFADNFADDLQLIWANLPNYLLSYTVEAFAAFRRFDIGFFIQSFLGMGLPIGSLYRKIDQQFELASTWVNGQIPQKYRSHPIAQEYIGTTIQGYRYKFNLFTEAYTTLIGYVESAYYLNSTEEYGPRSRLRLFFGGYTPTELAALSLRSIGEFFGVLSVPQLGISVDVTGITDKCEDLLTNNYTDWLKVSPRGN